MACEKKRWDDGWTSLRFGSEMVLCGAVRWVQPGGPWGSARADFLRNGSSHFERWHALGVNIRFGLGEAGSKTDKNRAKHSLGGFIVYSPSFQWESSLLGEWSLGQYLLWHTFEQARAEAFPAQRADCVKKCLATKKGLQNTRVKTWIAEFPIQRLFQIRNLQSRRPATGVSRALRARSVPGVSPRVSRKWGVSEGVSDELSSGPFGDTLGDTPGTLRARRARETPVAGRRDCNPKFDSHQNSR